MLERGTRQLHGPFVADGGGGDVGRLPQAVASIGCACARSSRVPQLEGTFEMAERCRWGDGLGRVGGGEQGGEGSIDVAREIKVKCKLTGPIRSSQRIGWLLGERGRDAAVQAGPLWREEIGVDDLAEQRVPEPVGVVVDHEQPCVDDRP